MSTFGVTAEYHGCPAPLRHCIFPASFAMIFPNLLLQAGAISLTDILGHASPADADMTKAAKAGASVLNAAVRKMTGTSLTATANPDVSQLQA